MEEYDLNPYHNQTDPMANILVTPAMIEILRATKPWVRLMSVISFVMAGLMILGGVFMMFTSAIPGMGATGPVLGILYILFAGLYIVPGYLLHQFASSINHLMQGGGDVALESALSSQRSFWRFVGIMTLVVICLYALFIIIMMTVGAMGMFGPMR